MGLNSVNHRSELSAWWHLQRQNDVKQSDADADCLLKWYMQGLIAIDRSLLITVVCDYLAGMYWFLIDQCVAATSTTVSVNSLSFSALLAQYCHYDTPGVGVAQWLPGGKCLLCYSGTGRSAKVWFNIDTVWRKQNRDDVSELSCVFVCGFRLSSASLSSPNGCFLHFLRSDEVMAWCELRRKVYSHLSPPHSFLYVGVPGWNLH